MKNKAVGVTVQQFAALPWRPTGRAPLVMLVTTRGAGRWILPKGWAEPALTGPELATKEAFEEAGIVGEPGTVPLGTYRYWKQISRRQRVRCRVDVFPLRVTSLLREWPEAGQRRREWLSLDEAVGRVEEAELSALLKDLSGRSNWWVEAEQDAAP